MSASGSIDWPTSHLQAADAAFAALTCDPDPLTLDCDALRVENDAEGDLPTGRVPLRTLRAWLSTDEASYAARDVVWRQLVTLARGGEPHWVIAAVGMAMPALVRTAGELSVGYRGETVDIDNEILTGVLEQLRGALDLSRPGVFTSLVVAASEAGQRIRDEQRTYLPVEEIEHVVPGPRMPKLPYAHPDLLVLRAEALRLIDDEDVEAWIDTRLAGRLIHPIAERLGMPVDMLRMRLTRADDRIGQALIAGQLSGTVSQGVIRRLNQLAAEREANRAAKAAERQTADIGVAA